MATWHLKLAADVHVVCVIAAARPSDHSDISNLEAFVTFERCFQCWKRIGVQSRIQSCLLVAKDEGVSSAGSFVAAATTHFPAPVMKRMLAGHGYVLVKAPKLNDPEEPPTLIAEEEDACDAASGFKPNFLKLVMSTDSANQCLPVNQFLPGSAAKPLVDQQKDAIHLYSGNSVYQQMNQALRKDDENGLKSFGSLINLTMQPVCFDAMQKPDSVLKPFVGTVWRGCTLSSADQNQYHQGNVVVWEGFSSTSKTSTSAFGGNCIFEIHCSKCLMQAQNNGQGLKTKDFFVPAQIQHLSQFPKEDEVLYPPYTKFRVVNRVQNASGIHVVLETQEFPNLEGLVQKGLWNEVATGIAARSKNATKDSPTWLSQQQQHPGSFFSKVAEKVASEGATSAGLAVIAQMQGLGANPQTAHDILKNAKMDEYVPLPKSHGRWYFDACLMNADDKQRADRIHMEGGTPWQEYLARQATRIETWYLGGQTGQVQFKVVNNIGKEVPYVVWKDQSGQMYQKATGGGMIGHHRRVRRVSGQ